MAEGLQYAPSPSLAPPLEGALLFVAAEDRGNACKSLRERGAIVARLDAIAVTSRGRLAELVETAISRELAARNNGHCSTHSLEAHLACAHEVGARGIAVALGSLRALIDQDGALDAADSRTARQLARATLEMPLIVLLDAADASLAAYAPPVPLASIVTPAQAPPVVLVKQEQEPRPEPQPERAPAATTEPETLPPPPVALPAPEVWRPWVIALTAARGPQPLAAFERLFVHSYMPLARAIEDGLDDARALAAYEEFRKNFGRAYAEACPTFALTGKRPRMVFDAPDLASKIARLHGARATQLLLVDGMRFDLGLRVRDKLSFLLGARASLAEELLLWSALPTSTGRQMELLARGLEAMRAPATPERDAERDAEPIRGRTAETIRRVKIGHRDVFKLDLIQAHLSDPVESCALADLADKVADATTRHAHTLQSRTLLVVFGDHGFARGRDGAVSQGGASPEEVLVPAFAFVVGAVH